MSDAEQERQHRRGVLDAWFERAPGRTGSGLADYIQRLRQSHRVVVKDGRYIGCVCGETICGKDLLLAWCDELNASYGVKVQEFAAETLRASELAGRLAAVEAENERLRNAVGGAATPADQPGDELRRCEETGEFLDGMRCDLGCFSHTHYPVAAVPAPADQGEKP